MTVKFEDNSVQVKNAFKAAAKQFLLEAAGEMQAQTQRNTTVGTGELKSSWNYQIHENEAVIGSQLQNALWEEFGTGEHAINGDGRKGAWYVPVEAVMSTQKKPSFNGEVIIVYGKNGQAFYKTNGKEANRPFYKAYTANKTKIIRRAESIFKDKMG